MFWWEFYVCEFLIGYFGRQDFFFSQLNDHNNYWHKKGIPGPKGNLLYGSLLDLLHSIHEFDQKQTEKYGKTFGTMMKGIPDLVTEDLDLIKEIVIKHFDAFPDRFNLFTPPKDPETIVTSLLTLKEGDDWRRIRHSITPAFTSGKMKKLIPTMHDCSQELVDYLDKFAKTGEDLPLKEFVFDFIKEKNLSFQCSFKVDNECDRKNCFCNEF